jgi:hypothetical protein
MCAQRPPHALGGGGHVDIGAGIGNRIYRGEGGRRAGLADALDAERVGRAAHRVQQAADIGQIVGRQLGQDTQVDLVLAESLLVSLQPEPLQLAPNVHRVVPALVFSA